MSARTKWEYAIRKKRIKGYDRDDAQLLAWLNRLGAEGWELVRLYEVGSLGGERTLHCAVLKRELPKKGKR